VKAVEESGTMDEVSKYRLTGAIIWLVLLVVVVPVWFGEPVEFKPNEGEISIQKTVERPLIKPVIDLPEEESEKIVQQKVVKQWLVRVVAYKDIKAANDVLGRLDGLYDVTIKTFEKTGMHSVRVGPFFSKAKAEQAKQNIDKRLYTQSEVVQLN